MTIQIDRRALLVTAGFGLGGLIMPGGSLAAQTLVAAKGFTHNVASGEPGPDSVRRRYKRGCDRQRCEQAGKLSVCRIECPRA